MGKFIRHKSSDIQLNCSKLQLLNTTAQGPDICGGVDNGRSNTVL